MIEIWLDRALLERCFDSGGNENHSLGFQWVALVPSSNACHTVLTLKLRSLTDPNSRVKPEPHPRVHNEKEDDVYMRRGGQPPQWTRRRRLKAHRPVICLGAKNYVAKTHQLRGLQPENGFLSFLLSFHFPQRVCARLHGKHTCFFFSIFLLFCSPSYQEIESTLWDNPNERF